MKEKSKKMKPFAFISIVFSLLLVVSVGYFWISKSADKSRAEDTIGVKNVFWATEATQYSFGAPYTGAVELCRTVDSPESGGEWHGWHDCTRGNYANNFDADDDSHFDFEQNSDWKTGDFYIHVKVMNGYGRYALPQAYHYDPNGIDLVLDSYGQILTGDRHTWICDTYHRSHEHSSVLTCDSDHLPQK